MTNSWRETTLVIILSQCDSRDIYNADEFCIFYRALPTKSMHLKGEKYNGGKNSKIGLTGLAEANMCREKIPMFFIEKSKKPCRFKGTKHTVCRYHAQKNKKRVGWTVNYLKSVPENRTESLHYKNVK